MSSRQFAVPLLAPVHRTSLNTFKTTKDLVDLQEALLRGVKLPDVDYARYGNATERAVEDRLAALGSAESALLFPSGMSAITVALASISSKFPPGSEIIVGSELYRQTRKFCEEHLKGVTVISCEPTVGADIAKYLTPRTKAIFLECPTNPYLRIPDLAEITSIAKERGVLTIVDSTFASVVNLRPLEHGVDIAIESATKYLAGHHDLLAGVVFGRSELLNPIRETRGTIGAISTPEVAAQLQQYLKTLELRVERHNVTGLEVATFLENHPAIERVWYPGLPSHPDHKTASKYLTGYGGVVTFTIKGSEKDTSFFIDAQKIAHNGPSFGGIEALVEQVALISHYPKSPQQRAEIGITSNLVRFSVGLESATELIRDLSQALDQLVCRQRTWRGFEKGAENWPVKRNTLPLNACYVAPLHPAALASMNHVNNSFAEHGADALPLHVSSKNDLRAAVGFLLKTAPANISIIPNCATGLSQIAEGFPFKSGDEIIGYKWDYPSNLIAWKNQERRGVVFKEIEGSYHKGSPTTWSLDELESLITPKTKMVVASHVQYLSGFAVDLEQLGALCKSKNVFLIVDAAQSAGALPINPESWGIDAVVSSGWKWLGGPTGIGFLYTSKELRSLVRDVLAGPDATKRDRYSDRTASLFDDGRRFEPSTLSSSGAAGLAAAIDKGINYYGVESIQAELRKLQEFVVAGLDREKWSPLLFSPSNQSGILSLKLARGSLDGIEQHLKGQKIMATVRDGYLRVAPPFYVTESELERAIGLLNTWNG